MSSTGDRQSLDAELLSWMQEPGWKLDESRFEALALDLFAYQFDHCSPYRRFAQGRGLTPETVEHWPEIPAVPAGAFKELALCSFPQRQTVKTFRTSGTSGQKRGELHLDTLALYEASLMASLDTLFIPDRAGSKTTLRILAPSASEVPDSSLSHMFQVLLAERGAPASAFDVADGELCMESLIRSLEQAQSSGMPVAICGTAFSFVHLIEALEARGLALRCPHGSRIMETGGFKGRSREMSPAQLYSALTRHLGVPPERIVNQYGMTELGSQFYDSVLTDPAGPRRKLGPPWARVRLIDPETGRETPPGTPGMVVIHDLANTGNIAAIQTADLGRAVLDDAGAPIGFEILGRHPDAEARGCSIAADEMLSRSA